MGAEPRRLSEAPGLGGSVGALISGLGGGSGALCRRAGTEEGFCDAGGGGGGVVFFTGLAEAEEDGGGKLRCNCFVDEG